MPVKRSFLYILTGNNLESTGTKKKEPIVGHVKSIGKQSPQNALKRGLKQGPIDQRSGSEDNAEQT